MVCCAENCQQIMTAQLLTCRAISAVTLSSRPPWLKPCRHAQHGECHVALQYKQYQKTGQMLR